MIRTLAVVAMTLALPWATVGQGFENFNLHLRPDFTSAEQTVELYQGRAGRPAEIASLRGSKLALATTAMIAQQPLTSESLERSLESAKFNQGLGDDPFKMKEARAHVKEVRELLTEVERRNFAQKIVGTVEQLFPPETRINVSIPVYFVAFGHQNVDAYVRRVVWRGSTPVFVGEGEGELSIVVDLSKSIEYGSTVDERFLGMMSVVAHEVFHAAFGAYKDASPRWQGYYAGHQAAFDQLVDLTQNEGIAYYLTLVQRTRGRLMQGWTERVQAAVAEFNRNALDLLSPSITPQRAEGILRRANTSGYWESFGAITGMIMARQIDQTSGRTALVETIANGPADFFAKYAAIMKSDAGVPQLSDRVVQQAVGR
jgi:hypothetical protein